MNTNLRELTIDETSIFISLYRAKEDQTDQLFTEIISDGGWALKAIEKRFKAHSIEVDKRTMILILSISDGIIGICAKYVDDIASICEEKSIKKLSLEDFSKKVYPWGIPSF